MTFSPTRPPLGLPPCAAVPKISFCGSDPVDETERDCLELARDAAGPTGFVDAVNGRYGARAVIEIDIKPNYLSGQNPAAFHDACVTRRTGQPPQLPLYAHPDWKG